MSLLLNRVALGLIQDARLRGGFGDDEDALRARAAQLAAEFAEAAGAKLERDSVELELRSGGRMELSVSLGAGSRESAELREDGVVLGGGTSRRGTIRTKDLTPAEREERRRQEAARDAARGKPKFGGKRYLRTLAAPPQPGAVERILAIELYSDGLIVEFTYDTELSTEEKLETVHYPPRPPMMVEDDAGTDYYWGERASYGGGPGASHSHFSFAPTPPAAAGVLLITTDSGTVEFPTVP